MVVSRKGELLKKYNPTIQPKTSRNINPTNTLLRDLDIQNYASSVLNNRDHKEMFLNLQVMMRR